MALLQFLFGVLTGAITCYCLQTSDGVSFLFNLISGSVTLLRNLVQATVVAINESRILDRLGDLLIAYYNITSNFSDYVADRFFRPELDASSDANQMADVGATAIHTPTSTSGSGHANDRQYGDE